MSDQLQLHPEGTDASTHTSGPRSPRQAATPAVPGEDLTIPTSKANASQFALVYRRRGVDVEVVKRGRHWIVVG